MSFGAAPLDSNSRRPSTELRVVFGRFDSAIPRKRRGFIASRVGTALGLARAILETLSYLHEPRIESPPHKLPPPRR